MWTRTVLPVFCFLILGISAPAFAQDCHQDIQTLLQSVDTQALSQEQVIEFEKLLSQAQENCFSGNHEEAARLVDQIRSLVGSG